MSRQVKDLKAIDQGITTNAFRSNLKFVVKKMGGVTIAAEEWGVWAQQITNAISGDKLPSPVILKAMGYESVKEIRYRYRSVK